LEERGFSSSKIDLSPLSYRSDTHGNSIHDPGLVIVGPTSAVMPIQTMKDEVGYTLVTQWRTIALSHMVEFSDIEPPKGRSKKSA